MVTGRVTTSSTCVVTALHAHPLGAHIPMLWTMPRARNFGCTRTRRRCSIDLRQARRFGVLTPPLRGGGVRGCGVLGHDPGLPAPPGIRRRLPRLEPHWRASRGRPGALLPSLRKARLCWAFSPNRGRLPPRQLRREERDEGHYRGQKEGGSATKGY